MRMRFLSFLLIVAIVAGLAGCGTLKNDSANETADYSTKIFGKNVITINITASEEDWQNLMDNATSKPTISADVDIDGVTFEDVGIKTKGNTSLTQVANSGSSRFSLKLNFDKYVDGQDCYGLDSLVLNNLYGDSTYLKEYMSYALMEYMDVPSSQCTFADIYVNGEHYGLFLAIEDVDESFLERNFGEDYTGEAYKPESMDMEGNGGDRGAMREQDKNLQPPSGNNDEAPQMPDSENTESGFEQGADNGGIQGPGNGRGGMDGGSQGVSLVYTDDEISSYSNIFDNAITKADEEDEQRLIATLKAISEGENLEDYIDVDEVLRYAAVNVFLVNLDSYFSNMGHNYCLYEDNGKLSMIPWDYNLSFGTYNSASSSDAINYAIDTVFSGVSAEERPIIGLLLKNEEYLARYHEYLSQLVEYVTSGQFDAKVDAISSAIDSYVQNDTTSFEGYDAFKNGVEALKTFASLRAESVAGQLDGSIPSTAEAQTNSNTLIDASVLNLSELGTIGERQKDENGNFGRGGEPPSREEKTVQSGSGNP